VIKVNKVPQVPLDRRVTKDSLEPPDSLDSLDSREIEAVPVLPDHRALQDSQVRMVSLVN